MYLGQWDVSLHPIKQNVFTEVPINKKSIVTNCSWGGTSSSTGMAAVVIAIARVSYRRKKAYSLAEQCLLIREEDCIYETIGKCASSPA